MAGATVATLSRKPCMSEHCSPPSQTLSFMSLPWSQGTSRVMFPYLLSKHSSL